MALFQMLRVRHWLKNLLVFFPLMFSGNATDPLYLLQAILAFVSYCMAASAVYIFNDVRDIDSDRSHPRKQHRPIASGRVSVPFAVAVALVCVAISIVLIFLFALDVISAVLVMAFYLVLNMGYSLGLKNIAVVDIAILASGFVLRVLFGGAFCGIGISSWMLLTIFALSVFLALGKRRGELLRHGPSTRKSLKAYTPGFLDKNLYMYLGIGLVFYSLWTFERIGGGTNAFISSNSIALVLGIPIVMLIGLRYSMDIESADSDGDPVEVIIGSNGDIWLVVLAIAWCIDMAVGLYLV